MRHGVKIWVALSTVYLVWGSTYLGIALAVKTIHPLFAVGTRFIAAGSIMSSVVVLRGGTMRVPVRSALACVLVGCLLPGSNAVLFFAERTVPIGLASLIIAAVPLWIVVWRLIGRERLPLPVLAGVGVGFAGVALLVRPGGGATDWSVGLCVLSSFMWATGTVLSRRLPLPADPFAATAYEMLGGGLVLLPLGIATMGSFAPSTQSVLAWIYLVTIGSVVGYTAYVWLLANAPLGMVSTYAYVNPIVAITLGLLFRGEHLSWRVVIGAAIIVSAVAAVVRRDPPTATQPEEGVR